MDRIPVFEPHIGVDTVKHLLDALDVGWLGMGATTQEFEERIADYLGLDGRHVVATNTGTSALHIALRAAGVGPGDALLRALAGIPGATAERRRAPRSPLPRRRASIERF